MSKSLDEFSAKVTDAMIDDNWNDIPVYGDSLFESLAKVLKYIEWLRAEAKKK